MFEVKPVKAVRKWRKCKSCGKEFEITKTWKIVCSVYCKKALLSNGKMITKVCALCGRNFTTLHRSKNVCSLQCRSEHMPLERNKKRSKKCEICGYDRTIDVHHDQCGTYVLCPNHHALITRGLATIQQLIDEVKQ